MRAPLLVAGAAVCCACTSVPPAAPPSPAPPAAVSTPCVEAPAPTARVRFRVTVDPSLGPAPVSGRLIVLWSTAPQKKETLTLEWGDVTATSAVVDSLAPGATFELDPDILAFPKPFSQLSAGTYQLMAVLDPDASFLRAGLDAGDLRGPVAQITLDPARGGPVDLRLDRRAPFVQPQDVEGVTTVHFESPLLTSFFGRPTKMRAVVALPPGADPKSPVPTAYVIPGFGGPYDKIHRRAVALRRAMTADPWSKMAFVQLEGDAPAGHHVFADSVNTGPWGRALVEELIPHLEKRFPLQKSPRGRFLTGHSSGGWASLWLLVSHPDFFGGAWSSAPDPVDFRAFFGVDITPSSTQNFLYSEAGEPRNLFRDGDKDLLSIKDFARIEAVAAGDRGGPLSTIEWVFSPRGPDGKPLPLFDRATGALSAEARQAWTRFDVRGVLDARWSELGPRLRGKIHLICGSADNFHLEVPTGRLCDFLKEKGSDATCEMVPGGTHFNLYSKDETAPAGLFARIAQAMLDRHRAPPTRGKK